MSVDPHYRRIANRLSVLELTGVNPDRPLSMADMDLRAGDLNSVSDSRFLNFYTEDGLKLGLKAYGLHDRLVAQGLGDIELRVSREDPYHQRLELLLGGQPDDEHRVMDLRIHLCRMRAPVENDAGDQELFDMMIINWLSMQNPRACFSREHPRLPGQKHPGTGLGRAIHNILMIMCERTGFDGLLTAPERFHLALLYHRGGYRFASQKENERLEDAASFLLKRLPFALAAWAVERGFLKQHELNPSADGSSAVSEWSPWRYQASEMLLPVSRRLKDRLGRNEGFLQRWFGRRPHNPLRVDYDGLYHSLLADPVEGLDPVLVLEAQAQEQG
ncbi:MAG: hypothetical protein GMKNLPBB_00264 [Myxococcota bacterium]|nr:hypothetical protein [Myxococcota bacterium]